MSSDAPYRRPPSRALSMVFQTYGLEGVTLEGVVARQMEKQIAEMQAKSVPGVFSVMNNLKVENE